MLLLGSTDDPSSAEYQDAQNHNRRSPTTADSCDTFKKKLFSPWITAHITGGIIMCLPIIVVFALYQDCGESSNGWHIVDNEYFTMLMYVALLHFCSFTQLSYLMKNVIAFICVQDMRFVTII